MNDPQDMLGPITQRTIPFGRPRIAAAVATGGLALAAALVLSFRPALAQRSEAGEGARSDGSGSAAERKGRSERPPRARGERGEKIEKEEAKRPAGARKPSEREEVEEAEAEEEPGRKEEEEKVTPPLSLFGQALFQKAPKLFTPSLQIPPPDSYPLGAGDEIQLTYWSPLLEQQTVDLTVDAAGQVVIPMVGTLSVHGTSLKQFRDLVRNRLSKYYRNVETSIVLTALRSIQVFVVGEVKRPGAYTISALSTVFNALYAAGGPTDRGSLRNVQLLRGQREVARLDVYEYLLTGKTSQDLSLVSGDTVFVPIIGPVVGVDGEVKRPALYELKEERDLGAVLDLAGGVTPAADVQRVQIERVSENRERLLLDVALPKAGATAAAIFPGDRVHIRSVLEQPANAVVVEGGVARPGEYAMEPNLTVARLVKKAGGIEGAVNWQRAEITRALPDNRVKLVPVNLKAALEESSADKFPLQARDKLIIYADAEAAGLNSVTISGAVKRPGRYRRVEGMTVGDLIQAAGGLAAREKGQRAVLERVSWGMQGMIEQPPQKAKPGLEEETPERLSPRAADATKPVVLPGSVVKQQAASAAAKASPKEKQVPLETLVLPEEGRQVILPEIPRTPRELLLIRQIQEHSLSVLLPEGEVKEERPAYQGRSLTVLLPLDQVEEEDPDYNVLLTDGDHVTVLSPDLAQLRMQGGMVSVFGSVLRPGSSERLAEMTVSDLVFQAGGVLPDAYLKQAVLERLLPEGRLEAIPVELSRALSEVGGPADLRLANHDKLLIYSTAQAQWQDRTASIRGSVQRPGKYDLTSHMQIKDLLFRAGGLLPEHADVAEVARQTRDGGVVVLKCNLNALNGGDESQNLLLADRDQVAVPARKEFLRGAKTVRVEGEVKHPGVYPLSPGKEHLSDAIQGAGGLTEKAFLPGASLVRMTSLLASTEQMATAKEVLRQSERIARAMVPPGQQEVAGTRPAVMVAPEPERMEEEIARGRLGINVSAALEKPGGENDIALEDGDVLNVPTLPVAIGVAGAVGRPSWIPYEPSRAIEWYVLKAGGYRRDADRGLTLVVQANGVALPRAKVRFVERGSVVVVPTRALILREKKTWWEQTVQAFQGLSGIATTLLVVDQLRRP